MIDPPDFRPMMIPRLSMMMFLQFFTWGTWFSTLGLAMDATLKNFVGSAYMSAPIAAIFAPLFLGLVADRFFASQRIFGMLMVVGSGIMYFIPQIAEQGEASGTLLTWLILAYMLCYMPTLGLGNTIAFTHIPSQDKFPAIRVWGTIGWIAAGLLVGGMGWSSSFTIFRLAALSSLVLGLYCFTLPHTPPPLKGKPVDMRSLLMVDAIKLFADRNFLVFAICSMLISIPLAWYHGVGAVFLGQTGFPAAAATLTLGQMSEIIFMLLIPFFFRHLGVKVMLLVGMAAWGIRFLLFSYGAPEQVTWMLLLAIIMHGICYDFFFVTGFIYTDQKAPREIRGQAQSLLIFLTQGVGMYLGFWLMGNGIKGEAADSFARTLKVATDQQPATGFFETFTKIMTRELPTGLDTTQLAPTMALWQKYWLFPAGLAGTVFILFALLFWDRTKSIESGKTDD